MADDCKCPKCGTLNKPKRYVGSTDTYFFCVECSHTYGGEETPRKKALIAAAARANVTEDDEVYGYIRLT